MDNRPKSEELEEAKSIAEEGVSLASEFLNKDEDVRIGYGWTEDDFTKENMNGVRGLGWNSQYFEIEFNSEIDGWKTALMGTAVHEFAHAYFAEKKDLDAESHREIWLYLLEEALTQNLTEELVPEAPEPWRYEHSVSEISEYWDQIREDELERIYNYPDELFMDREGEKYPNWLGYSLSYQLGQKLMEEYELSEFTELGREDVVEAGDQIFGQ